MEQEAEEVEELIDDARGPVYVEFLVDNITEAIRLMRRLSPNTGRLETAERNRRLWPTRRIFTKTPASGSKPKSSHSRLWTFWGRTPASYPGFAESTDTTC